MVKKVPWKKVGDILNVPKEIDSLASRAGV